MGGPGKNARMDNVRAFFDGLAVPLILSVFGGAARAFRFGFAGWRQFAGALFVSAFAGIIVHLLLQDSTLSQHAQAALAGLSGYSGGVVLDALAARLQKGVEKLHGGWDGVERRKSAGE